jgi:hypothetical protein
VKKKSVMGRGVAQHRSDIKGETEEDAYLAAGPDENDGRDAESGLRIPVREFYEMEMYVGRIVFVLDGPGDDVGGGQLGRIIDEGLDD